MSGDWHREDDRNGLVGWDTAERLRLLLHETQPVLELGDAELELVPLLARHEAELAQHAVQRRAGLLPDADRVAAPARRRLVDPAAHLVSAHTAARRKRVRQLVRPLRRQRDRADEREGNPLNGLVHAGGHAAAACVARASPALRPTSRRRRRRRPSRPARAPAPAPPPLPPPPPRTPPPARPSSPSRPCGARTRARAPSRSSAAAQR